MAKKFRPPQRPATHKARRMTRQDKRAVAALGLLLALSLAGGIMAQWHSLRAGTQPNAAAPLPTPGFSPGNPSRENFYAGGQLIASEAPAGTNAAPSVQLTAPANGASMIAPANLNLTATASDTDGSIAKVEFYQGPMKLGEDVTAPYSLAWNNVASGSYSLTAKATDNLGAVTTSGAVNITVNNASPSTQNVAWANPLKVEPTGNSLRRSATTNAWDGGASSTKAIAYGDGYVEFTVGEGGTYRMCGLSNGDTDQNYTDIDFALYPSANGSLQIYEGGVWRNQEPYISYTTADVFRVSVEGGVVKYKKNGAVFYTSLVAPTYPLRVDTALYTPNSTINNVVISGSLVQVAAGVENVVWTNCFNVMPSGNSLSRTATTNAWDGGAISTKAIASGDGYVEFTVGEGGTYRMCGLSHSDTGYGYADIDFAIYPSANNTVNIYEHGVWRGAYGTYLPGDKFKLSVVGGAIKYWHNDVELVVAHTPVPVYPLHVDASLYTPNSTIKSVKISGWLTP